jgi:adenine-specific DNA-methyltransferase
VDLSGMSLNEQLKKKSRSKKQEAWQQTFAFDERIALDNIQHAIHEYYLTDDHATKIILRSAINENVRSYILNLKGCTSDIQQKLENLPIPNDQFFLWHIYFKDVFDKGGFDIVIGNPPYISLQANDGLLADIYHNKGYLTFNGTGDIYSLFYEQGYRLLKTKGHLCFITSNKWMRNASGLETREFLTSSANPKIIFDFAGVQLFENATVETNILLFSKEENLHLIYAVTTDTKCKTIPGDLQDYAKNNGTADNFEGAQEWIILSPLEAGIQKKISRCAIPLKDWNLSINFGLKTGYNKAFIIDEEVRKNILEQCHTSEEYRKTNDIIRPILRGRDIKRYELTWANLWIINTHNGLKKKNITPIDVNELPAVKSHLDQYWDKLKSRQDKGITPYNLRNCAYLNELSQPKIIWGEISDRSKFCLDQNGDYLCEATTFFMTGDISIFLLCYLNSSLSEYLFSKIATRTGMGTTRWKKYKIEKLLVPKVPEDIISKVEQLYYSYKRDSNILYLQNIDKLIYDFYGLTDEEIAIIENSTK